MTPRTAPAPGTLRSLSPGLTPATPTPASRTPPQTASARLTFTGWQQLSIAKHSPFMRTLFNDKRSDVLQ